MMASELGFMQKAYTYFMDTALMDLSDLQSNTREMVFMLQIWVERDEYGIWFWRITTYWRQATL